MKLNTRLLYAIVFFVLLIALLFTTKPTLIFKEDGSLKPYGIGDDKTMFSFGVFTVVLAILSFYFFCIIDLVFK
jgi:hypothetical protein